MKLGWWWRWVLCFSVLRHRSWTLSRHCHWSAKLLPRPCCLDKWCRAMTRIKSPKGQVHDGCLTGGWMNSWMNPLRRITWEVDWWKLVIKVVVEIVIILIISTNFAWADDSSRPLDSFFPVPGKQDAFCLVTIITTYLLISVNYS